MSAEARDQLRSKIELLEPFDLLAHLREKAKALDRAALHDKVLTRQDLADAIEPLRLFGLSVAVIFDRRDKLVPTMSFLYDGETVSPVKDGAALRTKLKELTSNRPSCKAFGEYAEVSVVGTHELAESAARLIAEIGDVVFVQSLPARNRARDKRGELIVRLRKAIDSGRVNQLGQLVSFLRNHYSYLHTPIDAITYTGGLIDAINRVEPTTVQMEKLWARIDPRKEEDQKKDIEKSARQERRRTPGEDPFADAFERCVIESIETDKPFYFDPRDSGLADDRLESERLSSLRYLIMPVRSRADPGLKSSAALVLASTEETGPVSHELINSLNRCVDMFLARKYRVGQTEALALIERKLQEALVSEPLNGETDLVRRLKESLRPIMQAVLDSTAAYSAAILEYRAEANGLVHFDLHEHESARSLRNKLEPQPISPISLRHWRTRLSAFAFLNAHWRRSMYVPNLNESPAAYRELGLGTIFSRRKSGSEVSIPIRVGHFIFGVVNFEARYRHAFDSDLPFLEAIADAIGSLITCYYQSSDAMWLLDNLAAEQALHELKTDIERTEGNDAYLRDAKQKISLILGKDRPNHNPKSLIKTLQEISDFLDSIMSAGTADKIRAKRYFDWHLQDDLIISQRLADGINVILKNLLHNWHEHARSTDAMDDRLIVRAMPSNDPAIPSRLVIEASFHSWYSETMLDHAFVAPIQEQERTSHGLYIVGVVTRALKGTLSFTRTPARITRKAGNKTSELRLNIALPIQNRVGA